MKERIKNSRLLLSEVYYEVNGLSQIGVPDYLEKSTTEIKKAFKDIHAFLDFLENQYNFMTGLSQSENDKNFPLEIKEVTDKIFINLEEGMNTFNKLVERLRKGINETLEQIPSDNHKLKLLLLWKEIAKSNLPNGFNLEDKDTKQWFRGKIFNCLNIFSEEEVKKHNCVDAYTNHFKSLV